MGLVWDLYGTRKGTRNLSLWDTYGTYEHEQEETRRNVEAVRRNRKGEKTKRDWKQYTYTQKQRRTHARQLRKKTQHVLGM